MNGNVAFARGADTVVALVFDTEAAPFVVKNPSFNTRGGGPVELEVPWREGTSVRSGKRSDLIRLLVPVSRLPEVEVLSARVSVVPLSEPNDVVRAHRWTMELTAFIESERPVTFPLHRARVEVVVPTGRVEPETFELGDVTINDTPSGFPWPMRTSLDADPPREPPRTVQSFPGLTVIAGAGRVRIHAQADHQPMDLVLSTNVTLNVHLFPSRSRGRAVSLELTLDEGLPLGMALGTWGFGVSD